METLILSLIIGVVFTIIGILNICGNIDLLHSYHRDRVKQENRKPFGRRVGVAMIIIAFAIMANGILTYLSITLQNTILEYIGMGVLVVGLTIGLAINFRAIKKYNGKIF